MCGICGIYGESRPGDREAVEAMMESLRHRGPDGDGGYFGPGCALGHMRLAVIDLSSKGRQPMSNELGGVWVVVNGEIYNYREMKKQLEALGHTFISNSDSETVVHAYEEYGEGFIDRLRGMFAMAIYSVDSHRLILARDPSGEKPLYYAWWDRRLYFASEIKALPAAGVDKAVNRGALSDYLTYHYVPGEETLFRGIRKLPAGHIMTVSGKGTELRRYWQADGEKYYCEPVEELRERLDESVRLRLQADVPVGAFLSGGVDSSAVVALFRKHSTGKLHTFTATFGGDIASEASYAKLVSKHLETDYHEVEISPEMVRQDFARISWHHDEPVGDAAIACNYYLAREAKRYVTVVLAGEGGDELFGGYPWHSYAKYLPAFSGVPGPIRAMGRVALGVLADPTGRGYTAGRVALLPCQSSLIEMLMYSTSATSGNTLRWLLKPDVAIRKPMIVEPDHIGSEYNKASAYDRALATDYLNLLPEKFLMKADKATMAWAVEERLPLLDPEVVRLAFSLPSEWKQDKRVLREAMEPLLPKEIVWRPKQGFGTPVAAWLRSTGMKGWVADRLLCGGLLLDICRPDRLRRLVGSALFNRAATGNRPVALGALNMVWGLFALQVWHDVWFGGKA